MENDITGYVIVQDSRKNKGMNLALVDRSKIRTRWWTSGLSDVKIYTDKREAQLQCEKYKFNNPRVVPFDVAKQIIVPIVTVTYNSVKRRKNIFEMNIWEYKEWLGYSDVIEQGGSSGEL